MKKPVLAAIVLAAALGAAAIGLARRDRPDGASAPAAPAPATEVAAEPVAAPPPAAPSPEPARPAAVPPPAPPPTESALMAKLRGLGASDPAQALALAREGNRRFPHSGDAAERSVTICKSLAALGRFEEAQDEARQLVRNYPDTPWASDVQRHLLTQPAVDPAQRGFGKASELD
ncbi:MAG TPA: hypothetical protein VHH90_02450 [Polyangia bacterium]|nr:hypothetical protein [Polyangia bacterium]